MQIRVLLFGILKDLTGRASDCLNLPENATLADVLRHYEQAIPPELIASLAFSVNQQYARLDVSLRPGDEVALLPPVSGGSAGVPAGQGAEAATGSRGRHAAIVKETIDTASVLNTIKRPEDGAAVVFEGVVRNQTRGRRTLYLDYEAYEEMALKQMEDLAARALAEFKVRDVAIIHRLGRLEIGEASVLIVVASAHRAAAFDACRWLIDTLKRTVPIWKKEYFDDGAVWADGEAFPGDIPGAEGTHSAGRASK
jgi:MoaE-MoaD fusion protein